jgi:hypothetical protein
MISRGFYRFLLAMSRMGSHLSGKARVGIHWGQPSPVGALTCSYPLLSPIRKQCPYRPPMLHLAVISGEIAYDE